MNKNKFHATRVNVVFIFILTICITVGSFKASTALAASNPNPNKQAEDQERAEKVIDLLALLEKAETPDEVSGVLHMLTAYPYHEVLMGILKQLGLELRSVKNMRLGVVKEYIEALGLIGSVHEVSLLATIKENILNRARTEMSRPVASEIEQAFDEAFRSMATRTRRVVPLIEKSSSAIITDVLFKEYLMANANRGNNFERILIAATEILTDKVRITRRNRTETAIYGRQAEAERVLDLLVRLKGRNPMLVGPAGVGKTSVVELLAQMIVDGKYPQTDAFKSQLENAEIIVTSPAVLSSLAQIPTPANEARVVEIFLEAIGDFEKWYREKNNGRTKPIIIYIDEIHTLTQGQAEALKPFLDSEQSGIRLIGSSTSKEYRLAFKNNEAILRRFEEVGVEEFNPTQTAELLKKSWIPKITEAYNVIITEDALVAAIRVAPFLKPDNARPDGPFKVLQDLAIRSNRLNKGAQAIITDTEVYALAKEITGLPADPQNGKAFDTYLKELREKLNSQVAGQERMVNRVIDHFGRLLMSESTKPKVLVLMGGTGVGKTLIGTKIAEQAYGNQNRFFEIDGTKYMNDSFSLTDLLGSPPGYVGSEKGSGALIEWLDDPARGKFGGVILINEAEKMSPSALKRFMEFFDRGVITGGDGKVRRTNKHMIVLTSNRGSTSIFPSGITSWTEEEIAKRTEGLTSEALKQYFTQSQGANDKFILPPELVGRVEEFILASPITTSTAVQVGRVAVESFRKDNLGLRLKLTVSEELVKHLAITGYNSKEGGRVIDRQVRNTLGDALQQARAKWELPKDSELRFELVDHGPGKTPEVRVVSPSGEELRIAAPYKAPDNPLHDPALAKRLQTLIPNISTYVIGQDAAVRSAAQSIIAHKGDASKKNPVSLFVIGSTGTGKTELGRGIAAALYGSPDRAAVIPLGAVHSEADLGNIFGPNAGYSGHDTVWLFEEALKNSPDGGVIVFDEISNMGGTDKAKKDALIKKFYNQVEEGTWTSSVNGKVYDLRKYVFVFTGNDSDSLFMGISDDDSRMAVWKRHNSRAGVRELLRDSGVPEPFLGRMSDILLYKPVIREDAIQITKKLLDAQIGRFQQQHVGLRISYDEAFLKRFAETFFTQDQGGRSLRSVLDERLGAVITMALLDMGYDPATLKGTELKLSISDNVEKRPFVTSRTPERHVILNVAMSQIGSPVKTTSQDLTEYASERVLMTLEGARGVAFHEAGHALVNEPSITGQKLAHVTIIGGSHQKIKYYGYARYDRIEGHYSNPTRESVIVQIAQLYGGTVAQTMAGHPKDAGWTNDYEQISLIARRYLTEWGLDKELLGIQLDKEGRPLFVTEEQRKLYQQKFDELLAEGEKLARQVIEKNWRVIRIAAANLLKKGYITGDQFEAIERQVSETQPRQVKLRDGKVITLKNYADFMEREAAKRAAAPKIPPKTKFSPSAKCAMILDILGQLKKR
ncbi:MAG: AAA family ATPase [Oligoflexia bacterium]|nr:AAA family ATPase [Oligoflexia bacterium]